MLQEHLQSTFHISRNEFCIPLSFRNFNSRNKNRPAVVLQVYFLVQLRIPFIQTNYTIVHLRFKVFTNAMSVNSARDAEVTIVRALFHQFTDGHLHSTFHRHATLRERRFLLQTCAWTSANDKRRSKAMRFTSLSSFMQRGNCVEMQGFLFCERVLCRGVNVRFYNVVSATHIGVSVASPMHW